MKSHRYIIALVFVLGLTLWYNAGRHTEDTSSAMQTKEQLKQLRLHTDSLQKENRMLDRKYTAIKKQADSLASALHRSNQHYTQLKKDKHEAITRLSDLNTDGLYRFFSDFEATGPAGK